MATRRNRIVVKPNLKPAVPKSSAPATQKAKPKASTLQEPAESASIPGNQTVTPALPEKSTTTVTADVEKKKGDEKGTVDLQSGDVDGNAESGEIKQKLTAHLLKKSSNLTEEFENEIDGNERPTDESTPLISVEGNNDGTVIDNAGHGIGGKEPVAVDADNAKKTLLESAAVDTTTALPGESDETTPNTDMSATVDKTNPLAVTVEDDADNADTLATPAHKSKDLAAGDGLDLTLEEETPQPKPQRKKREKKERKEPLQSGDKSPDRHKMKMSDLIVWNPKQNYFPKKKKSTSTTTPASIKKEDRPKTPESVVSLDDESSNQSSSLPAPRVMIGPDGSIVLDTQSLIIENPKDDSDAKAIIEEDDDDRYLNSNSYRKTSKTKMWTEKENETFFIGLSMCGTDFSLMSHLLPKRSRRELKNKFRREEKRNRLLIDKALSSRQPYDKTPFERMAEEETARLKAADEIKKEAKRKCKLEAKEIKQKKIKKERGRTKKRKARQSEDEEDDWGDEPEYDDEESENQPEENGDEETSAEANARVATTARTKKRKMAEDKLAMAAQIVSSNSHSPGALMLNNNQQFPPPQISSSNSDVPTVVAAEETVIISDQSRLLYSNHQQPLPSAAAAFGGVSSHAVNPSTATQLLPPPPPLQQPLHQHHPQLHQGVNRNLAAAATAMSSSGITVRQQMGAVNSAGITNISEGSQSQSQAAAGGITAGLRSIPGTAPIQIEMEGVMAPMQGVLIPSHLVPQLAPQLGIPQSSTPMQVLLVQEEGGTSGSMVHVYVLPEKDSSSPFPQAGGQGRVTTDGSGQGLTLTSPVPSPHPPPRRPSSSSTPTSATPFSPSNSQQSFPFRSPPQAPSTSGGLLSADSETSMSTIRNVYGTAMNSLSPSAAASGKDGQMGGNHHHPPSSSATVVVNSNPNHNPLNCEMTNTTNLITNHPPTANFNIGGSSGGVGHSVTNAHLYHQQQQHLQQSQNATPSSTLLPTPFITPHPFSVSVSDNNNSNSNNIIIDNNTNLPYLPPSHHPPSTVVSESSNPILLSDQPQEQQTQQIDSTSTANNPLISSSTLTSESGTSGLFPKLKNLLNDSS